MLIRSISLSCMLLWAILAPHSTYAETWRKNNKEPHYTFQNTSSTLRDYQHHQSDTSAFLPTLTPALSTPFLVTPFLSKPAKAITTLMPRSTHMLLRNPFTLRLFTALSSMTLLGVYLQKSFRVSTPIFSSPTKQTPWPALSESGQLAISNLSHNDNAKHTHSLEGERIEGERIEGERIEGERIEGERNDFLHSGQSKHQPEKPSKFLAIPAKEEKKESLNRRQSSTKRIAKYQNVWHNLQKHRIPNRYIDTFHLHTPHPELESLLEKFYETQNSADVQALLKQLKNQKNESILPPKTVETWNLRMFYEFVRYQLVSVKELHLFLRLLYKPQKPLKKKFSKHYEEPISELVRRKYFIIHLLKIYTPSTSQRYPPLISNTHNLSEWVKAIENMEITHLRHRIKNLKIDDKPLFNTTNFRFITKDIVIEFIKKIENQSKKMLFIVNGLEIIDEVPDHSISAIQKKHEIFQEFKDFVLYHKTYKKDKDNTNPNTQDPQSVFQNISERNLKNYLQKMKRHQELLFAPATIEKIEKKHVKTFVNTYLKTPLHHEVFFRFVLKIIKSDILDYSDQIQHSAIEIAKTRNAILESFKDYIEKKLKIEEKEIQTYDKDQHTRKSQLPHYEDLEKNYEKMMIHNFPKIKKILLSHFPEIMQPTKHHLNKSLLQYFFKEALDTKTKKHIYLSNILKLDSATSTNFIELYNTATAHYTKKAILMKLYQMILSNPLMNYQHVDVPKSLYTSTNMQDYMDFYKTLSKDAILFKIKNFFHKTPNNYPSSSPSSSQGFDQNFIKRIDISHIEYFIEHHLQKNQKYWLIFASMILGISQITYQDIAKTTKEKTENIYRSKYTLIHRLRNTILGEYVIPAEPMNSEKFELPKLWKIYHNQNIDVIAKRIFASLHEHQHTKYKQPDTSQRIDLQIKYFINQYIKNKTTHSIQEGIKARIFLSFILKLDSYTTEDFFEEFPDLDEQKLSNIYTKLKKDLKKTTSYKSQNHLIADISEIKHKLWEATELYNSLNHEDILQKIKDSYAFHNYESASEFLTKNIVNQFISLELNNKNTMASSEIMWHIFFCYMLELCNMKKSELAFRYKLSGAATIQTYAKKMKYTLLYLLYKQSKKFQQFIKYSDMESYFSNLSLRMAKKTSSITSQVTSKHSYHPNGYLKTKKPIAIEILKQKYLSLSNESILKTFQNEKNLLIAKEDIANIRFSHIEMFLSSALQSDITWYVFFQSINTKNSFSKKSIDEMFPNTSKKDALQTIKDIQNMLRLQLKEIIDNQEEAIIQESQTVLSQDTDIHVWQLKQKLHRMSSPNIVKTFLVHNNSKILSNESIKNISEEDALQIVENIVFSLGSHTFKMHIFLALLMKFSNATIQDLAKNHNFSRSYIAKNKTLIKQKMLSMIKEHIQQNQNDANTTAPSEPSALEWNFPQNFLTE